MRYQLRHIRAQRTRSSPGAKHDDSPPERDRTNLSVPVAARYLTPTSRSAEMAARANLRRRSPVGAGPVAQWESVRFTRGRSLVRSQPGPLTLSQAGYGFLPCNTTPVLSGCYAGLDGSSLKTNTSVPAMGLNDDERAFNTALFGNSGNAVTRAYIATLMRLTANVPTDLRVGVETSRTVSTEGSKPDQRHPACTTWQLSEAPHPRRQCRYHRLQSYFISTVFARSAMSDTV